MQTSSTYRALARTSLQGRWGEGVLAVFVYFLIYCICYAPGYPSLMNAARGGMAVSWWSESLSGMSAVLLILVVGPLVYALQTAFLQLKRGDEDTVLSKTWDNLRARYTSFLLAGLLTGIIIVLVGVVTLGIGAVIFAYAYRMVPYLLHDYPTLSTKEALKTSREMMKGHKWDLFVLDISFIGWYFLAMLTLGIGVLWVLPYQYVALSHFYDDLKAEKIVDEDAEGEVEEVQAEEV